MRNTHGFTLLELAVVIVCFGVLFAGGLTMYSTHEQMRRVAETNVLLTEAREALLGYLAVHGRLPSGPSPWATLGVKGTDVWGNSFIYKVAGAFTAPGPSSTGDITVRETTALGGATIANKIAAIVVSRGPNGAGSHADETENNDGDSAFVSGTPNNNFDDQLIWISGYPALRYLSLAGKLHPM